jgi:hypothetical protein
VDGTLISGGKKCASVGPGTKISGDPPHEQRTTRTLCCTNNPMHERFVARIIQCTNDLLYERSVNRAMGGGHILGGAQPQFRGIFLFSPSSVAHRATAWRDDLARRTNTFNSIFFRKTTKVTLRCMFRLFLLTQISR